MSPPRFIYITGCDGAGKTTQAQLMIARLRAEGQKVRHVWLRFPFLLSVPLLIYARWRGLSWSEKTNGVRHGYWDFSRSILLRSLLPLLLFGDACLAGAIRIYLPLLLGRTVVCERFVLDMIADLTVAYGDLSFLTSYQARLYLRLIPPESAITILEVDEKTIRNRRPDLESDRRLTERLELYKKIAAKFDIPMVSNTQPMVETHNAILFQIKSSGRV